ncbi:hypothetical protein Drorol1_Dr00019379 [Drosera rotundifolia]
MKPPHSSLLILLPVATSVVILVYLLVSMILVSNYDFSAPTSISPASSPTTADHIFFAISSSKNSWPKQKPLLELWWRPRKTHGCVFMDAVIPSKENASTSVSPPLCVSQDASRFRYTYRNGPRWAVRVARIVSEAVNMSLPGVRWFVFGDGDTVFFPDNLAKTLSKYDHELWHYVGTSSESFEQNKVFGFEMAFWGAGIALSSSLAKVLGKVLDSCLHRYPHLFGSDGRIHACLAELGVGLTHEPGFHQMDMRGNAFGLLAAHPLTPLVSLHLAGQTQSIFPSMTPVKALENLFKAANTDSERIFQQTVCYDRWFSWTMSVSWGYAVEVFDHHIFLPDVLRPQETFEHWKKGSDLSGAYTINTRPVHPDPCRRSTIFFLDSVSSERNGIIKTKYRRSLPENCTYDALTSPKKLEEIIVLSKKLRLTIKQLQAPRRHCCDVLPPLTKRIMEVSIRECKEDELIHMHA